MSDSDESRNSALNDPDHWRQRAAEMRVVAEPLSGEARECFLIMAAEYDKLAERAALRQLTSEPGVSGSD